jgi:hypothetical protein
VKGKCPLDDFELVGLSHNLAVYNRLRHLAPFIRSAFDLLSPIIKMTNESSKDQQIASTFRKHVAEPPLR